MSAVARILAIVAISSLGGCAATPKDEGNPLAKIRTLGVVSAVGDTFRMSEIGPTVFQNRISDHAIPDWNVDDEATTIARRALEARDAYKAVAIPTGRQAEVNAALRPTFTGAVDSDAIGSILKAAQPQPAVDAFIVLAKARGREPCQPQSSILVEGVGICAGPRVQMSSVIPGEEHRDIVGPHGNRMLAPFASYRMVLLRASDFAVLAAHNAVLTRPERSALDFLKAKPSVPFKQIHSDAYKESFDKFTPEERRAIRKAIGELLEASIPQTLRSMALISD